MRPLNVGNDRFLNSASPVDTTKPALDDFGHGVWWPLALNDMPEECAQFAAQVYNALKRAQGDAWRARLVIDRPKYTETQRNETWLFEMTEAIYDGKVEYLRALIEAIYTA